LSEGCPSGQWEQTVNLPAYAYGGSNPPPSTKQHVLTLLQMIYGCVAPAVFYRGISSMVEL
jgi:hypothetical protein